MQAPQIVKGNLSEMTDEQLEAIGHQMYVRLVAQRKQILTAKIKAIDINNADLSKLTEDEIAVCLEYEILKHRTIPGKEKPLPNVDNLDGILSRMKNGVFKEPFELRIPPQKNRIVPPEKMALLDQKIRKAKIWKSVRDRMDNTSSPVLLTLCHHMIIPGTNTYYMCKYFSYKQQSTVFHIAFSHEFATQSHAIERNKLPSTLLNLFVYQKNFFDRGYMLKNKKKIFKHSEYFLVFSSAYQSDYDSSLKDLIKYLGISKKKLKENRNLISLWDSFPSLSRVISSCRGSFRRIRRAKLDFLENLLDAVIKDREENGDPEWFNNGETRTIEIIN